MFEPKTYSTDWEIMLVDKLERCVDTEKILGFAGVLMRELDLPVVIDDMALEIGMGINHSFDEFCTRLQAVTERAGQLAREFDLDLFPAGSHPIYGIYCGSHIHVGTIHDETKAIQLENDLMRFVPAFAALAANSPAAHGMRGEFKSYRIRDVAWHAATPSDWRDPSTTQSDWGRDSQPKIYSKPTVEVRIADCASSRRFLAEFAAFVAAFLHWRGKDVHETQRSADAYKEYLTNRWSASRHGLQATFYWDGKPRPVTDVLAEMLDDCRAELKHVGVKRSDLNVIESMLRKRTCQADFAVSLHDRYPDRWLLTSAYSKLVRQWDIFEEYLEKAKPLEPVPPIDEETILEEHLAYVGESTHFYWLRTAMWYPAPVTDEIIDRLVREGRITRDATETCGMLLHRTR